MTTTFEHSVFGAEDLAHVPFAEVRQDQLLDERQLSKSALRAFELLEFLAQIARPVRATEVAQALDLSPSSADQLLKSLASRAYLIFDSRAKLYRPSPRLLGFGAFLDQSYYGGDRLQALMADLVERTRCAVSVSTPLGLLMQLVHFRAPEECASTRKPGELFPMFDSAAGAALLATWPVATVRDHIAQAREQLGELADRPDEILAFLDDVRANGHAFGGLTVQADQCSVALALPKTALGVELTVSIRGDTDHVKARRWHLSALAEEAIALHLGKIR